MVCMHYITMDTHSEHAHIITKKLMPYTTGKLVHTYLKCSVNGIELAFLVLISHFLYPYVCTANYGFI